MTFARTEGWIPSPECSYSVKAGKDEALACKDPKESKNILFVLDANSNLDLSAFKEFVDGRLKHKPSIEDDVRESINKFRILSAH